MSQNKIQMEKSTNGEEQNKIQELQGKQQNQNIKQDSSNKEQTSNIQAQQQQQLSQDSQQTTNKPLEPHSNNSNANLKASKQMQNISKDDKIRMKLELMEKLKDLEGEIEQMEQEEEKALENDSNQVNNNSVKYQKKTNPLQSNASSEEYVKRIKELEKERKTLKQRREERILQYEAALQEQLQKQKEEEIQNKQKIKQMKKMESEKKLAEIEKRKIEREEKQREEKQKIHDIKSQKPLYVNLAEKFSVQQSQELEEKKKQLATLREISKPIDFNEIKQHQEQYDQKKKQKETSVPRSSNNNNEWAYEKPSYKSKIFEMYNNDVEHSKNNSEFKQKNAQQIVERRKVFSQIIKENFQPKQDPKKEQEAKEIQYKIHTQPRNQKNLDVMKAEGNEYLRNSIEKVKALKNSNSQSDKLSFREHRDQYRLNKNQQLSPSKLKSIQSSIQFDDHSLSNLNISQLSQNKKRQLSYHNSGASNQQNTNRGNEELNYGSNIFIKIQEDLNNNKRSFETVDEKKKFFDYVQREYRKKLGSKYMESARYQNSHPQNLEDHIKEEVDKELYKQKNPIEQKIQIVQNILKPYEEKAERDHRLLGIQQNDQQARTNVADTYLSSIKAKLALINKIQTESYEALKQQKANQLVLKVDSKSKRVSRKKKKASYFDAEKVNNIYVPSPKRNGSISPNIRIKTGQNQQLEQFSEYSPIKYTPQQTNRQKAQTKSAHKIILNEFQINKDEKQQESIRGNQQDKNLINQPQSNSYSNQKQTPIQQNGYQNQKISSQVQIKNTVNIQSVQKQEKIEPSIINNNQQVQPLQNHQQNYSSKNNQQVSSNQVSQQNQVVQNNNQSQQDIQTASNNQESSPNLQKSKNSQSNLSNAEREYLSKQQMQNNIKKNILILEKIQSGQNLNAQQQQSQQLQQTNAQRNHMQQNQPNNQQKNKEDIQRQNQSKVEINNSYNQNITPKNAVLNTAVEESHKKEQQNNQNGINQGNNNQSNQKNQQNIQQTQQNQVNNIEIYNDFSDQADSNYQSNNVNKKDKKVIDINEFEQQKQLQNQNILKKQFFSIQIQYITNIKEKNPITYHIQIVDKNTVVKDLDGLNIDIEPLDLIVPEEKQNIAIINDTLEVNYDPKKMLKHYANRLQDIYVVIRIIQEKNQNEELVGWIASPLFQENQFNYGIFKEQLYLPPDIFKLPLEKSKYQQSHLTIQFKIFEGKL
ncbi:hypothetical protein ABPG74_006487 [Tetrahymena malaccensis]